MPFIIFLLATAVFAQGTSEFMLAGILPAIAADLNVTLPQAGLLTSIFAAGMVVGAPALAALSRRWSPRLALTGFLAVFIGMHLIGGLTDSFGILLTTRAIAALTNAGFLAVTLTTVATLVPADRIAKALAVILGGTTLALIAGVPAGAAIGALLDWRGALWGVALVSTPALIAVLVAAPRTAAPALAPVSLRRELSALRRPALVAPLVITALVNGATFCTFTYLAPVITDVARLPEAAVPAILAGFGAGSCLGVWVAGRYADAHATAVLAWCGSALLLGWTMLAMFAAYPLALIALVCLQGALSFAVGSTLITVSLRQASDAPTMSGSFATAALNVGATVGPVLGGLALGAVAGAAGATFAAGAPILVSCALAFVAAAVYGTALWHSRTGGSAPS